MNYIANVGVLGKTNVGKSTIINMLMGKKVSIVSKKQNTTNNFYKFFDNFINFQITYIDSPGFCLKNLNFNNFKHKYIFDFIIKESNIILFIIDIYNLSHKFIKLLDFYKINKPIILIINKIDLLKKKLLVLPIIEKFLNKNFSEIIPVSSYSINDINKIKKVLNLYLKNKNYKINYFDENIKYIEILREKILKFINRELPYKIAIFVENIIFDKFLINIFYKILIKNLSQKKIIIGKNGDKIKQIIDSVKFDIKKLTKLNVNIYIDIKLKSQI